MAVFGKRYLFVLSTVLFSKIIISTSLFQGTHIFDEKQHKIQTAYTPLKNWPIYIYVCVCVCVCYMIFKEDELVMILF